jgi:transcriptional regulator with XRE-family HTH domain
MANRNWNTIKHKFSRHEHEEIKREARAELKRIGFDKLRKARTKTQVEVANRLNMTQAAVSRMEKRSDVLLSTLREYVGALGGRLEMRAVFPDGDFIVETFSTKEEAIRSVGHAVVAKRIGTSHRASIRTSEGASRTAYGDTITARKTRARA